MSLAVAIRHRQGDFRLDVRFEAPAGVTALFGPSGSGKSTLVAAIAGLLRPDQGLVAVDGETLLDTAGRLFVPPHRRRIGCVFQDARLFPHLTVRQNLLYGRFFAPKDRRREPLDRVVELLGIDGLLARRPAGLSGGEKQRVAIGRALLAGPRLLLMDEPLAALDDARKAEILPDLERLRDRAGIPIVYVSHAVAEVARLATSVVMLAEGKVTAFGPATDLLGRSTLFAPAERAQAGTVLDARITGLDASFALSELTTPAGRLRVPRLNRPMGTVLRLRIPARDIMLATARPEGLSAQNMLPGVIQELVELDKTSIDVRVDCNGAMLIARLTRRAVVDLKLAPGKPVHAIIKSVALES
jgi:molybdate transport system ATP-binding protein